MVYNANDNETVDNIQYDAVELSDIGETVQIRKVWMPTAQAWSPVYTSLNTPFSFDHYTSPRLPVDLGPFNLDFVENIPRVLRLTIKPVGSLILHIPEELNPAVSFIKQVVEYEMMVNPNLEDCEVHVTTDYGFVPANGTQRFPGWHVDGLQGGKFKNKLVAEHSYIAATNNPTEFCVQPFFIKHYDEDVTNFFKTFDQQAKNVNIYRCLPNHLYLMDAYMVHRTPTIIQDTHRGFIRITVANAPLPIEHNTLNPMLGQSRHEFKLDIRDWLREPDQPIVYEYYGLEAGNITVEQIAEMNANSFKTFNQTHASEDSKTLSEVNTASPSSKETLLEKRNKAVQDIGTFEDKPLTPGVTITAESRTYPKVQPHSPTYRDMVEEFNPYKYTNPRIPIDLGVANVEQIQATPNTLRMPLKWWASEEIHIPKEMLPIKSLLERIFTYDKCHNPLYFEQVAHITHDTREVEPGKTHRFPGFHGDDLQGGAFPEKEIAAHSYILTTNPATEFCLQPFFVAHVDDSFERHFTEFDKQALEENIYTVKSEHVYLMDPYAVHRTPLEAGEGLRTFLRITFSTPNMLLPHNTLNPMLADRQEEYENLPMPHLHETRWTQASDRELPHQMYGISR